MDKIYNKYGLKQKLLRVLVDLEYDLEIYNVIIVNEMIHNCNYYGDWEYFAKIQKRRGEIYIVLMHLKAMQRLFLDVEEIGESSSEVLSSIDSRNIR